MVRAEDLWHWLRLVLWVRAPLLATLCVTYILRSSHITHYFKAVVDPDMTYLVSVGSLSNMHFIFDEWKDVYYNALIMFVYNAYEAYQNCALTKTYSLMYYAMFVNP